MFWKMQSKTQIELRGLKDGTLEAVYWICTHKGTSVCNGDIDNAFQVFIPDEIQIGPTKSSGTWHVRGIVSTIMSRHDAPICDPNQYGVFTDVEKYTDWIKNHWED